MNVEVPVGSHATVYLPLISGKIVKESGNAINKVKGISFKGIQDGYAVMEVPSGKYSFETD